MEQLIEYRQHLLDCMQSTLDELKSCLNLIPAGRLRQPLEGGNWGGHQILAHLRDKEQQAFLPRIRKILLDLSPCLESFSGGVESNDDWMNSRYDMDESLATILAEYEGLWKEEMNILANLSTEGWSRLGRHPGWGVRTLQWWVEQSLAHARQHVRQLQVFTGEWMRQPSP
jgi:hypothetical protein